MKSIVFCSSQRFAKELHQFMEELGRLAKEKGIRLTILHPEFAMDQHQLHHLPEKERLAHPIYRAEVAARVYDHLFRKVKVADVCFVYNKNGYIGVNVAGELFAAAILGKMIYALEDKTLMGHYPEDLYEEPSVKKLVHEIVSTPEDLLSRLI
ncbi:hypothetical protein A3G55_04400 [Candidatus Giovannonibacteria bacterium RIFCSPLOWO2_12_FULL_44_25]|uniref:MazG nucleotide pyrophosphohydrolase n=4 Tax=Parcubacteria group TaxID=1794811 RepID=A0A1F5W746_9BACT|nr:MAG: hypothetical protein A2120_01780 [Candidatus Giovannonibacteria bacterium GWA2_45_15]OGF59202.1 MAG: hypothetical protein A2W40_04895 [Candidatus Giovannonibacteria bacterium RIFCSPHIGHO2_01_45_12]OGF60925.1 MAG: hypothetical protein A2656_03055 [Candidatus Giovannonibacteria bacterium RIFCSPHIGHO2_01_FULL_44_100]OGF71494.1 MAG: hypothetical protein A3C05_01880 [Candidatus Giovannonibacteria bacterium RIFCSPHIGHO2_02_FULL_45_40]OGF83881.1 MAG: hypothetical protein A3E63_04210 [Candidatu